MNFHGDITTVRTAEEMQALDPSSLLPENLPLSIYAALAASASKNPDKIAIQYILDGDCLDADRIPLKKRLMGNAVKLIKGKGFAVPYREHTYKEIKQNVTSLANGLRALGVERQDVTSIIMPNFPEVYFSLWAAETAGIANPVNPLLSASIIRDILNAAKTKVLIGLGPVPGSDIWEKILEIKDQVPSLKAVISVFGDDSKNSASGVPVLSFEKFIQAHPNDALAMEDAGQDDICSYFHTGGTTGVPKLAKHLHLNELTNATQMNLLSNRGQDDRILIGLPVFHVNAAVTGLAAILKNATLVMAGPAGFRGKNVIPNLFQILANYKIANMTAVPTVYAGLLEGIDGNANVAGKLPNMEFAIVGAAPLSLELQTKFSEVTGIQLVEGYGSTETTAMSTVVPVNSLTKKKTVGLPAPGVSLLIGEVDDDGALERLCDIDEPGEILVAGNHVFPGYVEEKHNQTLFVTMSNGRAYVRTGDMGKLDERGYLSLCGRKKELIIRGGHNIDPQMIEEVAAAHPDVLLAAAVARPDAYSGELPALYITLKPETSGDIAGITDYLAKHIPERAAIPKSITALDEMPLTAVGKIYKPELVGREIKNVINKLMVEIAGDDFREIRVRPDHALGFVVGIVLSKQSQHNEAFLSTVKAKLTPFTFVHTFEFE